MSKLKVGEAVLKSAEYLRGKSVDSPRLDAELLLARVLSCDRLRLYMDWDKPLNDLEVAAYRDFIKRRGQDREPVARILGKKSFYGRDFEVSRDTFVPRPETEGVVERALELLKSDAPLFKDRHHIFEVGTGSGCIVSTLAAEADGHHFIASDILPGALATARRNAEKLGVGARIDFRLGPLLAGYEGSLGMLVSNPPYIEKREIPGLAPEVNVFDPMEALDGGEDGLDVVRALVPLAHRHVVTGGWIVFELGEGQPSTAGKFFAAEGGFDRIHTEKDLAGLERYLVVRRG
jgi:release factor glutamine methyltransferase